MANFKYFNGIEQLTGVYPLSPKEFTERFPGATAKRDGSYYLIGRPESVDVSGMLRAQVNELYVPAERAIEYKKNPSKHKCDARCQNATGRIMKCECSCGGRNHGLGFNAEEVTDGD